MFHPCSVFQAQFYLLVRKKKTLKEIFQRLELTVFPMKEFCLFIIVNIMLRKIYLKKPAQNGIMLNKANLQHFRHASIKFKPWLILTKMNLDKGQLLFRARSILLN